MPGILHFLVNPFVNATTNSAARASTIGHFTDVALYAESENADIAALYNQYHPVWAAFEAMFGQRVATHGQSVSKAFAMQKALRKMSDDVKEWAFAVEAVHRRNTPPYLKFFPRGRSPFRDGRMETRIAAVGALALALQDEPLLASLHATVQQAYADLDDLATKASGGRSSRKKSNNELETARLQLCEALYAVLGGLIRIYPNNPDRVKHFFDVRTMHRHKHRSAHKSDVPAKDELVA